MHPPVNEHGVVDAGAVGAKAVREVVNDPEIVVTPFSSNITVTGTFPGVNPSVKVAVAVVPEIVVAIA